MAHEGELIVTDDSGREQRFECSGGLDSSPTTGGGLLIHGVVNLKAAGKEAAVQAMEEARAGRSPTAHYSGEVYTEGRRGTRRMQGIPVRIEGIDETGNVRIESDGPVQA